MPLISSAFPFVNPYLSLFVHSWPSFLFQIWSVLTLATWPMQFSDQLSFWSFFPVKPAHKPCRAKGKYPIQSRFSLMGWKKKKPKPECCLLKNSFFKCCYKSQPSLDLQYSLILSVPSKALEFIYSS